MSCLFAELNILFTVLPVGETDAFSGPRRRGREAAVPEDRDTETR